MPFQACPDIAKISLNGLLFGEECINTIYAKHPPDTPWTIAELEALADGVFAAWSSNPAIFTTHFTYESVTCTDLTLVTGPQGNSSAAPVDGGDAGEPSANNVAWTVKFLTGNLGRSYRGRNQVGGITVNDLDDPNHVKALFASDVIDIYNAIKAAIVTAGGAMCVLSRRAGGVERPVGIGTLVNQITYTDLITDSQRTRLPGRGA